VLLSSMTTLLLLVLFVFIAVRYLRNNTVAFIASAFALSVFRGAMQLFEAGATVYFWHGILLLLIGVAVLIWLMTGKSSSKLSEVAK
jgi:hypothetical protein